jgi:hypothetical protein
MLALLSKCAGLLQTGRPSGSYFGRVAKPAFNERQNSTNDTNGINAMPTQDATEVETTKIRILATKAFLRLEVLAYIILGLMLALTALIGIGHAGASLWASMHDIDNAQLIIITIDRLLFVLMLVEILHTVRDSFRSGTLVCEPFLIVGLIASIRRVLSITLQASQANQVGNWSPETEALLHATTVELVVLGGLILVMVVSICLLRYSKRLSADT